MENFAACAAADILVLTVLSKASGTAETTQAELRTGSILIDATVALAAGVGGRASRTLVFGKARPHSRPRNLSPKA